MKKSQTDEQMAKWMAVVFTGSANASKGLKAEVVWEIIAHLKLTAADLDFDK